mgnify:CR=1 FL=1
MGKGDKKSKRGKIVIGSYGVRRPQRKTAAKVAPAPEPVARMKAPDKEKTPAKQNAEQPEQIQDIVNPEVITDEATKPAKKKSSPKAAKKEDKAVE